VTGPFLAELRVEANGGSALVPAFSPDVHDYYVRCETGANMLVVSAKASAGSKVSLAVETPAKPKALFASTGTPAAALMSSVGLKENQAIVATASDGSHGEPYWVRCLPHDVSPMKWSPHGTCPRPPGYYLVGNVAPSTGRSAYALVLDTNGVPVWYAAVPSPAGLYDLDEVVEGSLSFIRWPPKGGFEFHDLDSLASTQLTTPAWSPNPHEIRRLPNGHFLVFTDQQQSGVDLTGYNVQLPDGGVEPFGPDSTILTCDILEVDSTGKVWWHWISTDHLDPVKDSVAPSVLGQRTGLVPDPFHCNSIDVDPANGNLLVSARNMDSVFYVDRATGAILWKMGGATFTKDHTLYVPVAAFNGFQLQHDARFRPGWSPTCGGQISIFDDEWAGNAARAVVYDVTLSGKKPNGETCGTLGARIAWKWPGTAFTESMGSFRILDDGSRIIGWGYGGEPGRVFTEVDSESHNLLDFYFTDDTPSYRALKLPRSALDLELLRNGAGLNPP
jgi:hypothetical protein